jgi:predicted DNA-binding protein (MmcQ/YjbR family)
MTVDDFRKIALSLEGAEESSHMGQPDFRVGGRIFATLAAAQGYGNLMLTPEQQSKFVEELRKSLFPSPVDGVEMGPPTFDWQLQRRTSYKARCKQRGR